jgi:glucans biosynthesis protein
MGLAAGVFAAFASQSAASAQAGGERAHASAFSPATVALLAQDLAGRPYVAPWRVGGAASQLGYDTYRMLVFRRERQFWRDAGLNFTADALPAGYLYPEPVALYEVTDGRARPIPFSPELYDAPEGLLPALQGNGFSGLRLQHPLNRPDHFDEFAVFQGASYFRSLGRGQRYGLSARGLALGAGGRHEEFPAFRAFWVERPAHGASTVVIHALLDSPSVAGAYRFEVMPGERTAFDVEAILYPRRTLADVGLCAQSSMFLHGQADHDGRDDFRGAVHDSEGLAIETAEGARLWRPLSNPASLQETVIEGSTPRGFGLLQRSIDFETYGDLEARYDLRPGLWVEPQGDWGPGAVHLVEIPTRNEAMDNIVAFWRPATPLQPGQAHRFSYRLHWGAEPPSAGLRVVRTRSGAAVNERARQFAIDFRGPGAQAESLRVQAFASAGQLGAVTLSPHPDPDTVRAAFTFEPPRFGAAELDLRLASDAGAPSETWRFRWTG